MNAYPITETAHPDVWNVLVCGLQLWRSYRQANGLRVAFLAVGRRIAAWREQAHIVNCYYGSSCLLWSREWTYYLPNWRVPAKGSATTTGGLLTWKLPLG